MAKTREVELDELGADMTKADVTVDEFNVVPPATSCPTVDPPPAEKVTFVLEKLVL
jgi:hypothetical protein